ncbi:MAG: hypothetical protein OSA99_05630 [Acidimicrobiales bacterium]|nr:hypothetical protein [Acidimicrobiales bacterium]
MGSGADDIHRSGVGRIVDAMVDVDEGDTDAGRRVDELADVLVRTVEIAMDAPGQAEWSPFPASLIDQERAPLEGAWLEAHLLAWTYVAMTAQAATDHLASLGAVLRGRTALGLLVMARTAGEAAGQGWWLAEDGIGHVERVRRAYGIRARGLMESERLASQFLEHAGDHNQDHLAEQRDRIRANRQRVLRQARDDLGFKVHREGEELTHLVDGPTSRTELFRDVMSSASIAVGGIVYGQWSGVAHSNPVTLLDYHDQTEIDADTAGLHLRLLLSTVESTVYATVNAHRQMMDRVYLISGWDATAWEAWKNDQTSVMSAT